MVPGDIRMSTRFVCILVGITEPRTDGDRQVTDLRPTSYPCVRQGILRHDRPGSSRGAGCTRTSRSDPMSGVWRFAPGAGELRSADRSRADSRRRIEPAMWPRTAVRAAASPDGCSRTSDREPSLSMRWSRTAASMADAADRCSRSATSDTGTADECYGTDTRRARRAARFKSYGDFGRRLSDRRAHLARRRHRIFRVAVRTPEGVDNVAERKIGSPRLFLREKLPRSMKLRSISKIDAMEAESGNRRFW